jgi:hypothetical protein
VESVNGEVMYRFDTLTNEVTTVISFQKHKNGYYFTRINKDTLELGETFQAQIILEKLGKIAISQPKDTLSNEPIYIFKSTPDATGTYTLEGKAIIDSHEFPFLWKYVVVNVGERKNKFSFTGNVKQYNTPF